MTSPNNIFLEETLPNTLALRMKDSIKLMGCFLERYAVVDSI